MKIGIYGGSFNPIHIGHIEIARQAIKELNLDKLYFVPAYKSPFKSKIKYAPAEDRVNMINLVKPEGTEISMFEINRKNISYTIDTISYFKQKFPHDELFLIIGSDNVGKLNKWKNIDEISTWAKIIVFKRDNNFSKENIKKYNCLLIKNALLDYASSWFRKGYMKNVDDKVMKYIASHFLYIPDIMVNMLDAKRHKHSIAVGHLAAELAKATGYDAKKAWVAGSLHDITKSWPKEDHRAFLTHVGVDESKVEDFALHSLTGYYWIKTEYQLEDEEILNAILKHTSLGNELTLLDKIIFAADKLADGRKFDGIQEVRALILKDFDKGFKATVKAYYEELNTNRNLTEEQKAIFKRWM